MKKNFLIIIVLALLIPVQSLFAKDVISAAEAAKNLKSSEVIFVSVRSAADYQKVHIAGAVHVDLSQLYTDNPVPSVLKSPAEVAKVLGEKGISEKKQIVIYDDGSGKSAGRMYWIMSYMGAPNVKVLNGGMKAWRAARKPVTKNPTSVKGTTFTPNVNKSTLATTDDVNKAISSSSIVLIDARSAAEFSGTDNSDLRKGHIPGAINIEFSSVLNANGTLKSNDDLTVLFNNAGVTKDKGVILYCKSSVRAGIVYLALKSALAYANVKVYDGAFLEWESVSSNKVEK